MRLDRHHAISAIAALVVFVSAAGCAEHDSDSTVSNQAIEHEYDYSAYADDIDALGEWHTERSRLAIQKFMQMGDEGVPILQAALIDIGQAIEVLEADLPTDAVGFASYVDLEPEEAESLKNKREHLNLQHNKIVQLLQANDSAAAQAAMTAYAKTRTPGPTPPQTINDKTAKPIRVWSALDLVIMCGKYDENSADLAMLRIGNDQHPRVRSAAVRLAVLSGRGSDALPIALEMAQKREGRMYGGDMQLLLTLAYAMGPDDLQQAVAGLEFRQSSIDTAVNASHIYRANEKEKYATFKKARSGYVAHEAFLTRLVVREMLQNERSDKLQEFGYVRPLPNDELKIMPKSRQLFFTLGYNVTAKGKRLKFERLPCY